jgi:hypothetical protein
MTFLIITKRIKTFFMVNVVLRYHNYASNVCSLKLLNLSKDFKLISNLKEENTSIIVAFFDNIKFVN